MAVSPVTGKVYLEDGGCVRESVCTGTVAVISGQTNKAIDSIEFPACEPSGVGLYGPGQFAIGARTGNLYVPIDSGNDCQTSSAQVVSGQTNKIMDAVRLPTPGQEIAGSPATGDVYLLRPENTENDTLPYLLEVLAD